jgi:predicted lipid-binding transport protein (Tim44 family)
VKKLFLVATIGCYTSLAALAQYDHSSYQSQSANPDTSTTNPATVTNGSSQQESSQFLSLYYNIKDALVSGNASATSAKAGEFMKTAGSLNEKVLPVENKNALLKDAEQISKSKDIKQQRELFAGFSNNMAALAKAVKLTTEPVYQQYCPMKKASWLSSNKAIKNPYFGSAMLTCGKNIETL